MKSLDACPLCSQTTFKANYDFDRHVFHCTCEVCGKFCISGIAIDDNVLRDGREPRIIARAVLSHRVRLETDAGRKPPELLEEWLLEFVRQNPRLPTVAEQASNVVRYVGDLIQRTGRTVDTLPISFGATIGALSRDFALKVATELVDRGLLSAINAGNFGSRHELIDVDLTLDGWERYEAERHGKISGRYGFIALKFGDAVLDPFVRDFVKPAVQQIGYELVDMRDAARAGVIDNLLRSQIRDAAFLLVDLTHDNPGAYWEAGYAEGLGKPVLYICEKNKFDHHQTHFDTNHCTTVLWEETLPAAFQKQLIATLRRSLNLFSDET